MLTGDWHGRTIRTHLAATPHTSFARSGRPGKFSGNPERRRAYDQRLQANAARSELGKAGAASWYARRSLL